MNKKELVCYWTDASRLVGRTEKVFFPKNAKEVQDIVKNSSLDIVPRGAGTGFMGGTIPRDSIVIDMGKMNNVLNFNPARKFVIVEPGITLKELNEKLGSKGFEFPIDLCNNSVSTIGGMIATNASGNRSMKYGTMRDWVDEVEFVNGNGEIIKTSKADLMDVCGMEGITGIITSAKLRIMPLIKRSMSLFQSDSLDEVISVSRRLKSEKEVCMLKLFSKEVSVILGLPEKYNLIVEFDSVRGKIKDEEYEKLSKIHNNVFFVLASENYYENEDPKFFFDKIQEFCLFLEERRTPYFVYPGQGIVHPFFKEDEKNKKEEARNFVRKIQAKFGKYGYGIVRKGFLDSFEAKIIQRIKSRYDPNSRFNRGKVVESSFAYSKKSDERVKDFERVKMEDTKKNILLQKPILCEKEIEIEPMLGEEMGAYQVVSEMDVFKQSEVETPEKKMEEFIKEVSKEQKPVDNSLIEIPVVEAFAKKMTKEIAKESELPLKPRLNVDYNQIRDIMNNKYRESEKQEKKEKQIDLFNRPVDVAYMNTIGNENNNPVNNVIRNERGNVSMINRDNVSNKMNIERGNASIIHRDSFGNVNKNEINIGEKREIVDSTQPPVKKTETSQEERDMINRILGNRFSMNDKNKDKNGGKRND